MAKDVSRSVVTIIALFNSGLHRLIEFEFHVQPRLSGDRALILLELLKLGGDVPNNYFAAAGIYAGENISYNLARLEEGGYITRMTSDTDARVRDIRITEKGVEIALRLQEFLEPIEDLFADAGFTIEVLTKLARDIEDRYRALSRIL